MAPRNQDLQTSTALQRYKPRGLQAQFGARPQVLFTQSTTHRTSRAVPSPVCRL